MGNGDIVKHTVLIACSDMNNSSNMHALVAEQSSVGRPCDVSSVNRSTVLVSMKGQIVSTIRADGLLISMAMFRFFSLVRNVRGDVTVPSTLLFGNVPMAKLCRGGGLFITSTARKLITALKTSWLFLVPSIIIAMMTKRDVLESLKPRIQPCGSN